MTPTEELLHEVIIRSLGAVLSVWKKLLDEKRNERLQHEGKLPVQSTDAES